MIKYKSSTLRLIDQAGTENAQDNDIPLVLLLFTPTRALAKGWETLAPTGVDESTLSISPLFGRSGAPAGVDVDAPAAAATPLVPAFRLADLSEGFRLRRSLRRRSNSSFSAVNSSILLQGQIIDSCVSVTSQSKCPSIVSCLEKQIMVFMKFERICLTCGFR